MTTTQITTDAAGKVTAVTVDGTPWAPPVVVVPPVNSVDRVAYCMAGAHEGLPHGVPVGWSWAQAPQVQAATPPPGMSALTVWGQVYTDTLDTHPPDDRVAFRGLASYVYSKAKKAWLPVQVGKGFDGAHFVEDFAGNASAPWSQRTEPDGSCSVDMAKGFNAHFYPRSRGIIGPPADVGAVFTTVQARVVEDVAGGVDNRSQARWLCNIGADWWRDLDVPFVGDFSNNPGVGQGRFVYLSPAWQAVNFYTGGPLASTVPGAWTETQLRATPPPFAS